jgi:hypothetical protein
VAQWERSQGSQPTSSNLAKISVATNVNFDWLATGRGARRLDTGDAEAAFILKFSAQCGLEERLLLAFRKMGNRQQHSLLAFVETLVPNSHDQSTPD